MVKIRDSGPRTQPGDLCGDWRRSGRATRKFWGYGRGRQEGAKFWLQVLTELKNRGVEDIFIACVDGLKGFPEAIETMFPAHRRCSCALCTWCGLR